MRQSIDPRELRQALARFATGVAVATTLSADGRPIGLTINSFSSVSLDPPLVLWSLSRGSPSLPAFVRARHFAVNLLGEEQQDLSERFSRPQADRFAGLDWSAGVGGAPVLPGCLASFECRSSSQIPSGDHVILLGHVERFRFRPGAPLIFFASRYGLPARVAAAADA